MVVEKALGPWVVVLGLPSASFESCRDEPEMEYAVARRLIGMFLVIDSLENREEDFVIAFEATLRMWELESRGSFYKSRMVVFGLGDYN